MDKVLSYVANLRTGQPVTLHFNIKGYNGQKGNFTGLEVWKVDSGQSAPQQQAPQQTPQQTPPPKYQAPTADSFGTTNRGLIDDLPF